MRLIRSCVDDGASPTSAAISLTESRALFCSRLKMAISVRSRAELWLFYRKVFVPGFIVPTIILVLAWICRTGFDTWLPWIFPSSPDLQNHARDQMGGSHDHAATGPGAVLPGTSRHR